MSKTYVGDECGPHILVCEPRPMSSLIPPTVIPSAVAEPPLPPSSRAGSRACPERSRTGTSCFPTTHSPAVIPHPVMLRNEASSRRSESHQTTRVRSEPRLPATRSGPACRPCGRIEAPDASVEGGNHFGFRFRQRRTTHEPRRLPHSLYGATGVPSASINVVNGSPVLTSRASINTVSPSLAFQPVCDVCWAK